jgi:hypothetical protein
VGAPAADRSTRRRTPGDASGPRRAAPSLARAVAAALALLVAGDARAASLRVLLLVGGGPDRELAARVEGQSADLDLAIQRVEGALPADLRGQVAVARAAGARADVVIWFGADAGESIAYIATSDRIVARRVGQASGPLSRSASIEALAVAARTVVAGIAAARAERAEAARRTPGVRAWGEAGWIALLDGTRPSGRHGVALRAGTARGRWSLAATAGLSPAAEVAAAPATIEVSRQQAGVVAGLELLPASAGGWSVALELGAGAARYRRATTAAGDGLVATPAAVTWSAVVAPGLRVARRALSGAWLALGLGADVLATPPRFLVRRSTGDGAGTSPWACEPRVGLSLLLDWR